jgi:hypothetical protein
LRGEAEEVPSTKALGRVARVGFDKKAGAAAVGNRRPGRVAAAVFGWAGGMFALFS